MSSRGRGGGWGRPAKRRGGEAARGGGGGGCSPGGTWGPGWPLRVAENEAVALEVGEVLAHRVGGDAEVGGDRFGAGVAFTPEQLQDFHTGGPAGDGGGHIRTLWRC